MAIIAFLLPFCNISCGEQSIELKGYELVVGKTVTMETPLSVTLLGKGAAQRQTVPPNPYAIAAIAVLVLAAAASFSHTRIAQWAVVALGALAIIALGLLNWNLRKQADEQHFTVLEILFGYHLAAITAVLGTIAAGIYAWQYPPAAVWAAPIPADEASDIPETSAEERVE